MKKIIFIILHYQSIVETRTCVKSIENNIDTDNYKIIIVDNASPNNTGLLLIDEYKTKNTIEIILSNENLGFAQGNNLGIRKAKEYGSDFIVVCNNDIVLIEKNFLEKVRQTYDETKFAVLGPMILTRDGNYDCSPVNETFMNVTDVETLIKNLRRKLWLYQHKLERIYWLEKKFKQLHSKNSDKNQLINKSINRDYNVKLHGCFLVLSPIFQKEYNGFNPNTFLYMEEDILHVELQRDQLKSVYDPTIKIYHMEDAATNFCFSGKDKQIFTLKHQIESCKVLRNIVTEQEKKLVHK